MNTQPKHDPEMGDLRGFTELVAKPNDIAVGDLPNTGSATDDLRGQNPLPETDPESNKTRLIIGAAILAAVIGGIGIYNYAGGMLSAKPPVPAPRVAASMAVPAIESAAVPQQAPVLPAAAVPAAPVPAATEVVRAHVAAPIKKRAAPVSPEITPIAPLTAEPPEPDSITPAPPAQILPDQPAAQTPPTKPVEPPQ